MSKITNWRPSKVYNNQFKKWKVLQKWEIKVKILSSFEHFILEHCLAKCSMELCHINCPGYLPWVLLHNLALDNKTKLRVYNRHIYSTHNLVHLLIMYCINCLILIMRLKHQYMVPVKKQCSNTSLMNRIMPDK